MTTKTLRTFALALATVALLGSSPAEAAAPRDDSPRQVAVRTWLDGVVAAWARLLDAVGTGVAVVFGKEGHGIDPNGGTTPTLDPAPATDSSDHGHGIDPDG